MLKICSFTKKVTAWWLNQRWTHPFPKNMQPSKMGNLSSRKIRDEHLTKNIWNHLSHLSGASGELHEPDTLIFETTTQRNYRSYASWQIDTKAFHRGETEYFTNLDFFGGSCSEDPRISRTLDTGVTSKPNNTLFLHGNHTALQTCIVWSFQYGKLNHPGQNRHFQVSIF